MSGPTPDSPTDFSLVRHSTLGLILRLRSVAESECEDDPWLANLCVQSADEIERLSAEAARHSHESPAPSIASCPPPPKTQ